MLRIIYLLRVLFSACLDPFKTILVNMEGYLGIVLRRWFYRLSLGSIGKKVRIDPGVYIAGSRYIYLGDHVWIDRNVKLIASPFDDSRKIKYVATDNNVKRGTLRIGDHCHIAPDVIIQAHGGVKIGSELTIGSGVKIYSLSHHYRNTDDPNDETPYRFTGMVDSDLQFLISGPVIIGDGSGIGMNAVVLPGSVISSYAWLTVSSVLKGKIPPGGIASGNPARTLKFRPGFEKIDPDGGWI